MVEDATTTIRLTLTTKARLDKLGDKGDTYEDIIVRLLDDWVINHDTIIKAVTATN